MAKSIKKIPIWHKNICLIAKSNIYYIVLAVLFSALMYSDNLRTLLYYFLRNLCEGCKRNWWDFLGNKGEIHSFPSMPKHPRNPLRRERLLAGLRVVEAGKDVKPHLAASGSDGLRYLLTILFRSVIFRAATGNIHRSLGRHLRDDVTVHSRCDESCCKGVGTLVQQTPHAATTHRGTKQIGVLLVGAVSIERQ